MFKFARFASLALCLTLATVLLVACDAAPQTTPPSRINVTEGISFGYYKDGAADVGGTTLYDTKGEIVRALDVSLTDGVYVVDLDGEIEARYAELNLMDFFNANAGVLGKNFRFTRSDYASRVGIAVQMVEGGQGIDGDFYVPYGYEVGDDFVGEEVLADQTADQIKTIGGANFLSVTVTLGGDTTGVYNDGTTQDATTAANYYKAGAATMYGFIEDEVAEFALYGDNGAIYTFKVKVTNAKTA
jgi:hypothetical protein